MVEIVFEIYTLFQGDDEPTSNVTAARQLSHFDHAFKSQIHTCRGPHFAAFGELQNNPKDVELTCQAASFDILQDALTLSERKKVSISYSEVS